MVILLLLTACNREAAPEPAERRLVVFSTLFPLADIAREVGGDRVRVDWLLDLGDPIDTYALTPRDRERFSGTDIVLCDGLDRTETWARFELDRFRNTQRLITVNQTASANEVPADGLLCLDPVLAGRTADAIADAIIYRQPRQRADILARADAFKKKLDAAVAGFRAPADARVIVLSNLFQPLLARVKVKQILVPADVLKLAATDLDAIRRAARSGDARAIVVPFDTPPGTLMYLEEQTGLKPFPLDALGYPNYTHHASYLDVLRFNLDQLRIATQ